jgi:alpha-tubulin suppressor-like RCC1 family protein
VPPIEATTLSTGGGHSCELKPSGEAVCWGNNYHGQLGNGESGSNAHSALPVAVVDASGNLPGMQFKSITSGEVHGCGLTQAGAAYCWGHNASGQLGNGTTQDSSMPVLVSGGKNFTLIAAGQDSTCGLTSDNQIYCWGYNHSGQLGDGDH